MKTFKLYSNFLNSLLLKILLGIAVLLLLLTAAWFLLPPSQTILEADNGHLNISSYDDFSLYILEGQWDFYPNQLLSYKDFRSDSLPQPLKVGVPENWEYDSSLYGIKFGTYSLVIHMLNDDPRQLAIASNKIFSACSVMIDDIPLYSLGQVADNIADYSPSIAYHSAYFTQPNHDFRLIIQVADFSHDGWDGIIQPIQFGSPAVINRLYEVTSRSNIVISSFSTFIFLFFSVMLIRHSQQKELKYFLVCVILSYIWTVINGVEFIRLSLLADKYNYLQTVNLILFTLLQLCYYHYIIRASTLDRHKARLWITYGSVIVLAIAFICHDWLYLLLPFYFSIFVILYIHMIHIAYIVYRQRLQGWPYICLGIILWIILAIADFSIYASWLWQVSQRWILYIFLAVSQTLLLTDRYLQSWLLTSQKLIARNELNYLRSQISQHFIHNTLESVNALIDIDSEQAQKLLKNFSDYLRYYYTFNDESELWPLREEIKLVEAYLAIESVRLGPRLQQEINIDENCLNVDIPPLSVQPLVENAIKHGIFPRRHGGLLTISAHLQTENLVITISDNGIGVDADCLDDILKLQPKTTGVGLRNIARRLQRMVGGSLGANGKLNHGLTMQLLIPLKE